MLEISKKDRDVIVGWLEKTSLPYNQVRVVLDLLKKLKEADKDGEVSAQSK